MITKETVEQIVAEAIKDSDIYIIDVQIRPSNSIIVVLDKDSGILIEDCKRVTKHIESQLDRDVEDYELEVSSAGISSPFSVYRQYVKNIGRKVEVHYNDGKKQKGILKSVNENAIELSIETKVKKEPKKKAELVNEVITISFDQILKTKLVIEF